MEHRSKIVGLAAVGIIGLFAACGGSASTTTSGSGGNGGTASAGPGGTGASAGTGTGTGAAPGTTTGGDDGLGGLGPVVSVGAGPQGAGGDASCAGETSTAELVPLDLYIMLDTSGSMDDRTSSGVTKWDAIKEALAAFLRDPRSEGIGVGIQYFPLSDPAMPETCTTHEQCGEFGPCYLSVCYSRGTPCNTDADCGRFDECVDLGRCSVSGDLCAVGRGRCRNGGGDCVKITESACWNWESCDAELYATPAVEIAPLDAAAASALIDSIDERSPNGATPTAGALRGAIDRASAHASANPNHKVVAVLATDGQPTVCNPTGSNGLADIARAGAASSPSVPTFVIGVFERGDTSGHQTMNRIAEGGGTTSAFIIDTDTDVAQAFLDALNEIRGRSLSCEYQVPTPSDGQSLDYGTLNVEHTPPDASEPTTIFYVADEASCDPTAGGWYYDVNPASGGTPTKVVMCPATCTRFQAGGEVALRIGCKTEIPPPPH